MITGFNTDIKHGGKVFHVQTEDKGINNPKIETLIYVGGQILNSYRFDYSEKIKDGFDEAVITKLMENQHKRIIRDIKTGKYDEEENHFDNLVSTRSLDEVVFEFLKKSSDNEELDLTIEDEGREFFHNSKVELKVNARKKFSQDPVSKTKVLIKILSIKHEPALIQEGYTDIKGHFNASFSIPELSDEIFTLQIEGAHPSLGNSDIKYIIKKGNQ